MVQPTFSQRWLPSPQKYSAAKFFKNIYIFMLTFARGNGLTYGCIATKKLPGRRLCRMFGQHEPRLTSCQACRSKHQSLLTRRFLNPMVGNRIWAPAMIVAVWSGGSPHGFWADSRRLHKGYVNPLNEILQNLFFFFLVMGILIFKIFWVCISVCEMPEHHSNSLFLRSWVAYFQPRGS